MKDKIKIIDAICERHPAYGVDKGWSEYTGGMKDSGQWFFRKMLDCNISELKVFLENIIKEENKPETPLTEQEKIDNKIIFNDEYGGFINKTTLENLKKFHNDIEFNMILGKK